MQTLNNITVTANTSQAVSAVQVLNNQWSEMNNALGLVGRALGAASNFAGKFVAVGTKIEDVNKAARAMSKYGLGKGMLQALRAETSDVVDQMVLAQNATRLLGSGAVQSVKEMTDAFEWAITQGDKMGVTADSAVAMITDTLIGGRSTAALKDLGVQIELTGTKAEKTAQLMQHIQKEIKYSDDAFAVTADGFGEKMQQMKNSMLDAVEGFSLFNKGFSLVSGSVEWVTKKLKKSTKEIWGDIESTGKLGMQKLQDDVARTVSALTAAKVAGDTAGVDFLQKKLDKTLSDGQAFLIQFGDLYDQFGKAAGAKDPVEIKGNVTEVLTIARAAAQDAEADIDKALDKIAQLDERAIALVKRDAKDSAWKLEQRNKDLEYWTKKHMAEAKSSDSEELVSKRMKLQAEIRQDILKITTESAAASNMVFLLEQGQDELLRRKDRILAGHFSTLLKTLDTERKAVEERRKYGKILDNGVAAEKNLEAMKKDYIAVLDGQLKIATQLNDAAKMKYLIEAKDKAEAIKTLADLEKQLKEQEVKDDKKKAAVRVDEQKKELAFLRLRLKLASESGQYADVSLELKKQISQLEKITKLTGSARDAEIDRVRAIEANEQTMQRANADRKAALKKQRDKDLLDAERDRTAIDDWVKKIKFFDTEHTKIVQDLKMWYAELQEIKGQDTKEGLQILDTLEMIGHGAKQLATDTEGLAQPTNEQIELYKKLGEAFSLALKAGDQKLADSIRYRMTAMRSEATVIEEIAQKGRDSESKLIYAQYAQESIRQSIADKELDLKVALRDKSYERAAALREEITALQQQAEANGQAMKKMEQIQRQYQTLGEVGSSAISAISQAAWADKDALEKYHGSRLKMAQDLFADEMKKKAISETVLGFSAAGQASLASVFAPPAAPALWASSALHFLAAGATGLIGASMDVSTSSAGAGGGGASSTKTGIGDMAPAVEQKQEIILNVNVGAKDGWVGNIVDAIIDEQRRGKARRGVS